MEKQKRVAPSKKDMPERVVSNVYKRYLQSVKDEVRQQFFDILDGDAA